MKELRLAGVIRESIVDGPGLRMSIFTQGCPHHCEGCQNPQTHDPAGGYVSHPENILREIDKNPLLRGVTFTGGEPFMQAAPLAELAVEIHKRGLDIVTYTGFTYEELLRGADAHPDRIALLEQTDYLIDGRFILARRSLNLRFRGSDNQRIISVGESLQSGSVVQVNFE